MTTPAAAPSIAKRARKTKDVSNIESPVPGTVTPTVAATTTPPTDEMTLLYNALPADERAALIASYKIKGLLASAHSSIIQAFASVGIKFKGEPLIMVSTDDEEETAYAIEATGEYSDLDDEGDEDEDESDDEDEDEAPVATKTKKSKGKRGPGRPPKHHGPGRPTKAASHAKALVKALKELMEEKGYNQEQVSEKLDVSQGTISNWLNGTSDPQNGNSIKLEKFVKHYLA
jgi:DNA-binding XRE family transcriptional regulator